MVKCVHLGVMFATKCSPLKETGGSIEKLFFKECKLKEHYQCVHCEVRPFGCDVCNISFAIEEILCVIKPHIIRSDHFPMTWVMCHSLREFLKEHMFRYKNDYPYSCDLCGKYFSCQSELTVHKSVHIGERTYFCNVCDKSFNYESSLKEHLKRLHNLDRP